MRHVMSRLAAAVAEGTEVQYRNHAVSRVVGLSQTEYSGSSRPTTASRLALDGTHEPCLQHSMRLRPATPGPPLHGHGTSSSIGKQTHNIGYTQGDCSR
jgi:hypothetical protein